MLKGLLIKIPVFQVDYPDEILKQQKYAESEGLSTKELYLHAGRNNSEMELDEACTNVYDIVVRVDKILEISPVHIPSHSDKFIAMLSLTYAESILVACEFNEFLTNFKDGKYLFM